MRIYLAFLRGINVGGNGLLKMADLVTALTDVGLQEVQTYIQSGNVIFESDETNTEKLSELIEQTIETHFKLHVAVAIFSKDEWKHIIRDAPEWWGKDTTMKHNLLILIRPTTADEVMKAIGELKPDIEAVQIGEGMLYQSLSLKLFGRTTSGKLATNPVYHHMTVRSFNTAQKLSTLLD